MKAIPACFVLTVVALLDTACLVGHRGRVAIIAPVPVVHYTYVEREPPPVRYERLPPPPAPDQHWVAGHWNWDGRDYVWVPGYYHVRPHPRAAWIDGHWERHERGWYWIEGHWR